MSKEQKQQLKEKNEKIVAEYGYCLIDGHKQKIGNFRIEPPGLFRGRGDHPKQGMLKKRVLPKEVIINCSKFVAGELFGWAFLGFLDVKLFGVFGMFGCLGMTWHDPESISISKLRGRGLVVFEKSRPRLPESVNTLLTSHGGVAVAFNHSLKSSSSTKSFCLSLKTYLFNKSFPPS